MHNISSSIPPGDTSVSRGVGVDVANVVLDVISTVLVVTADVLVVELALKRNVEEPTEEVAIGVGTSEGIAVSHEDKKYYNYYIIVHVTIVPFN